MDDGGETTFGGEPRDHRWRRAGPPGGGCVWAAFDGEFAVFDRRTGRTHLLDPYAAEIFDRLEAGPADETELELLLRSLDASSSGRPPLSTLLEALAEARLVERTTAE